MSGKHDLIFFSNRSTPKVVSQGMRFKAPESYGKVTKRRAATADEERQIAKGKWVRVDSSGKKPKDSGYRQSNLRPQFNRNKKNFDETELEAKGDPSSLDRHPNSTNWVENTGQLPTYIREIANALIRDHGFTISRAIATALNRLKYWIASPNTTAATKAKATKALAQWEALKAKNKIRVVKNRAKKAA